MSLLPPGFVQRRNAGRPRQFAADAALHRRRSPYGEELDLSAHQTCSKPSALADACAKTAGSSPSTSRSIPPMYGILQARAFGRQASRRSACHFTSASLSFYEAIQRACAMACRCSGFVIQFWRLNCSAPPAGPNCSSFPASCLRRGDIGRYVFALDGGAAITVQPPSHGKPALSSTKPLKVGRRLNRCPVLGRRARRTHALERGNF